MAHRFPLQHIDCGNIDLRLLSTSETANHSATSSAKTHKGYVRFINEDAFLQLPKHKLWVVADGMGGLKRGDYASKSVIRCLNTFTQQKTLLDIADDLQQRLVSADKDCKQAFRAKRVGSTVALLFEFGGFCFFVWSGDSRIYRLRDNSLELMTRDHSLAQEKLAKGELNQDEAEEHPSAHILTSAIGVNRNLKLELRCASVAAGDRYLICSDGVYGGAKLDEIQSKLNIETQTSALDGLIEAALDRGGRDNITAIVVDFD